MDKSAIQDGIEKLAPWFHKVELPYGLTTKTENLCTEGADHPLPTWQYVRPELPEDLTGKRVLDIGCNGGFYSFEAAKRGASEVVGVDAKRHHMRQATFAANALGHTQTTFKTRSLYQLNAAEDGTYDVVLALGLVYHLKHIIRGIEALYEVCDDLLILESAVVATPEPPSMKHSSGVEVYPVYYADNPADSDEAAFNWFFPSAEALQAMLSNVGFVDVKICSRWGDRAVLTARKGNRHLDSNSPAFLGATLEVDKPAVTLAPGDTQELRITARNTGRALWLKFLPGDEEHRGGVVLTAQMTSEDDPVFGYYLFYQGAEKAIPVGGEFTWTLPVTAPDKPGNYTIEIDLASHNCTFFQEVGAEAILVSVTVA